MSQSVEIVLERHVAPDHTRSYIDVPSHTVHIDVPYEYSDRVGSDPHLTGGNTVDIGIFDVRGHDFMGAGFRGWTSSARDGFFLALHDTTPGLSGRADPGRDVVHQPRLLQGLVIGMQLSGQRTPDGR